MKFEGLTMNQLAERNAVLVQELEKAREVTNCPQGVDLQDHLKDLVTENLTMKAFGGKLDEMHNDLNGEGTGIQGRAEVACQQAALEAAMEEFDRIETPATDSILRAAEARGVEKAMERIQLSGALTFGDCYISLNEFAQQLREGKA